jgi:malate dehydrogenase (oxaloacetate-decarboxylating)(NADP+)
MAEIKYREAQLGIAIGMKGVGKSYSTLGMMQPILRGNTRIGAKPRKVLILDVNNEFGDVQKDQNENFAHIRAIRLQDVGKWCHNGIIEARRVTILKEGGGQMTLKETADDLGVILENFKNGLLLIEDITKFLSDSLPSDLIGAICTQRHKSCDIILHFQSVGKMAHPKLWANCNWLRFHKTEDTVKKHENKFGTDVTHLYLAEKLVDIKYESGNKHFVAYVDKDMKKVKLVTSGAGAAALACLGLLVKMGVPKSNIFVTDLAGVVYEGRTELMDEDKIQFVQKTSARTLDDVIDGADIFLGLSAGGVLKPAMVKKMAKQPLILALANPTPEILPEEVLSVRTDAIIATGRSDYHNQVNNVLCFPYIFRGALDAGASTITDEMEIASVYAIAELAQAEQSEVVAAAYVGEKLVFGPEYLIPKPFDPRLMMKIAPAVAKAAADSGVARRPIQDMEAYIEKLQSFVYASGSIMKPIYAAAKLGAKKRVCFAEGEEERVLRAVQIVVDEGLAKPTLIGRPAIIAQRVEKFGLRLQEGKDYQVVNVEQDLRYRDFWQTYWHMMARKGVTQQLAKIDMRRRLSLIGTMMLHKGEVDGLICGTWSTPDVHLNYVDQVIGNRKGVSTYACMNGLLLPDRQVFLVDTHINYDPTAEQLCEITTMAAEEMRRFGLQPKAALLSHSNFGTSNHASALKMRETLALLKKNAPWLEVDGEMHGDVALDGNERARQIPDATLIGDANLLVLPNLDSANIAYNLLKTAAGGNIAIGPVLLGAAKPVHILTASATVRRIVNMTALTVADASALR